MPVNIYDTINQLERELRDHAAYQKLVQAMEAVIADPTALQLYQNFREVQRAVQMKFQMGQEVSEEEIEKAQEIQKDLNDNATLNQLLTAEQELNRLIDEINQIVTKPIYEIYQKAEKPASDQ